MRLRGEEHRLQPRRRVGPRGQRQRRTVRREAQREQSAQHEERAPKAEVGDEHRAAERRDAPHPAVRNAHGELQEREAQFRRGRGQAGGEDGVRVLRDEDRVADAVEPLRRDQSGLDEHPARRASMVPAEVRVGALREAALLPHLDEQPHADARKGAGQEEPEHRVDHARLGEHARHEEARRPEHCLEQGEDGRGRPHAQRRLALCSAFGGAGVDQGGGSQRVRERLHPAQRCTEVAAALEAQEPAPKASRPHKVGWAAHRAEEVDVEGRQRLRCAYSVLGGEQLRPELRTLDLGGGVAGAGVLHRSQHWQQQGRKGRSNNNTGATPPGHIYTGRFGSGRWAGAGKERVLIDSLHKLVPVSIWRKSRLLESDQPRAPRRIAPRHA